MTWLNPLDEAHFAVSTIQASRRSKVNLIRNTRDSHKISGWCFCGSWVSIEKNGCFIQPTALCESLETLGKDTLPDFGPKPSLTPKVLYNLYVKGARQQANDFVESARWCGLNPDYWGLPKIFGQCFLWLISSQWIGHLIQPHSPTRQQTNGLVESIRRCTYAASRSFNDKSNF